MGVENSKGPISSINVTPFVDIVLVLLVVLMITAVQIVRGGIPVELPKAASAGELTKATLNIVIPKGGDLFLDGAQVSAAVLAQRVRDAAQEDPKVQVVIAADKSVAYQAVVRAIDIVKRNGVTRFALDIEQKQ